MTAALTPRAVARGMVLILLLSGLGWPRPTSGFNRSAVSVADTLDSRPPVVHISYPAGGEVFAGASSETLRWTLLEDDLVFGTSPMLLQVFDAADLLWSLEQPAECDTNCSYVWTTIDVNASACRFVVTAQDRFGWVGTDTSQTFIIQHSQTGVATPAKPVWDSLGPNYPNPFNPHTTVTFSLNEQARIILALYDARGRKVATLAEGHWPAGRHAVRWNGRDTQGRPVPSGPYLARLQIDNSAGQMTYTHRMILVK